MSKPKIGIIVGSTRANRFADQPAEWIAKIAAEHADLDFEILDLRDYPLPFYEEATSLAWAPAKNPVALRWQDKVRSLDGFVVIAAEYNHGPTAVLKNAFDYAFSEWNNKPVAFVGYGGAGAVRAVEQLRQVAIEVQMAPIRNAVHILLPDFVAVLQQGRKLEEFEHLNQSANAMLAQLSWWAHALKSARDADGRAAQAA